MRAVYQKGLRLIRRIGAYNVTLYAANASFYLVLSFFPAVMLMLSLLPFFHFTGEDLLSALQSVTPDAVHPLIETVIYDLSTNSSGILISATTGIAVWSSSKSVYCIQQGLNSICRVRENRNYFIRRLSSMLYTVILIAALLLTLVLHGFGSELAVWLESKTVPILQLLVKLLRFRGLVVFFLLAALFTAFYCILPNQKRRIGKAFPGAALSALGWQVFTYFFSIYVRHSGSYSLLYGSLAGIAIGMLWLYICFSILFYGCVFNLWLDKKDGCG